MEKIKKNYTNFVLTVIAVALIGILFKGEIVKPVHAVESHTHESYEIYGLENHSHSVKKYSHEHDASDIWGFDSKVRDAVNSACSVNYGIISC